MSDLKSDVSGFLQQHDFHLKKSLGQNFLINQNVLEQIVAAGDIQPTDTIVEIGPGIGVLSRELTKKANHVIAIELDDRLPPLLRAFTGADETQLEVRQENALAAIYPDSPYKIIANIPYHITSPLLRRVFTESVRPPQSLTLLIQREVAEKICSVKDASLLSIVVQLFGTPRLVCIVPPSSFVPPPRVDSAVIHIDCYPEPKATPAQIDRVFALAKLAFSQKRKMLRNTLGSTPDGAALLEKAGIEATRRPQTLSIDEWLQLASFSA